MTHSSGRWSYWHAGVYADGYYDVWDGDRWVGWTTDVYAAMDYVLTGTVSNAIVAIHEGMRVEQAADIILEHLVDAT